MLKFRLDRSVLSSFRQSGKLRMALIFLGLRVYCLGLKEKFCFDCLLTIQPSCYGHSCVNLLWEQSCHAVLLPASLCMCGKVHSRSCGQFLHRPQKHVFILIILGVNRGEGKVLQTETAQELRGIFAGRQFASTCSLQNYWSPLPVHQLDPYLTILTLFAKVL